MATPADNQALALGEPAQTIGQAQADDVLSASEISLSKTWNVPDYLNQFFKSTPVEREQILANIEQAVSAVGGFGVGGVGTFQDVNLQTRTMMAGGAIASLLRTIGQSVNDDICAAQRYAADDDLVTSILDTKDTFFSCGFGIGLQTDTDQKRGAFKSFNLRNQLYKVEQDLMKDWNCTDNLVLVWSVQGGELAWLTSIGAERCIYENYNGAEALAVMLDSETVRGIKLAQSSKYPARWLDAAKNGGKLVLDEEQGDGWAVVTKARKFNGFARPRMRSVFFDLMLRDLLKAGEWSCAMFLQSCIQHVKIGPTDGDIKVGPRAGQRDYPYKAMLDKLNLMFATPARARRMITDATVSIEHVVPNVEIFTKKKFESCDSRIEDWGGVPVQLRTGQGDGYSQGFLGKSRFEADGLRARQAVETAFNVFFADPKVRQCKSLRLGKDEISYTWNKQILKDPKQVLEEIKFMQNNGGIDWRTVHELLGVDHDTIKARMIEQAAKDTTKDGETIWQPVFEPRQGLLTAEQTPAPADGGGEAGRPSEGGPLGRRPRASLNAFGRGVS
jgi:hypothetical protein